MASIFWGRSILVFNAAMQSGTRETNMPDPAGRAQHSAAPVEGGTQGGGQQLALLRPGKIRLRKHIDVENGFVEIAQHCLLTIELNRNQWLENGFADGLHQMRVGLRRMHSTLQLFKDAIRLPDDLALELRWLTSVLGPARDWEVFCGTTLPQLIARSAVKADLALLQKEAAAIAQKQGLEAKAAVQSPRYDSLLSALNLWLDKRAWRSDLRVTDGAAGRDKQVMPLALFASAGLVRRHRNLARCGARLDVGDPATHHRLRIAVKRARYTVEFFRSFFPAKTVRRYLKTLDVLQDSLGSLNDMAVACTLLDALAKSPRGAAGPALAELAMEIAFARGFLVATMAQQMESLAHCRLPEKLPALG
jgi:CHAD domain-containing protein